VPEQIGTFEHARHGFDCRSVQRNDAMARLFLAPSHVQQPLDDIHIAPPNVLDLRRTHRRVGSDDGCAVDVLPFRTRGGDVEQAPLLLARQRSADGPLTLWQVLDDAEPLFLEFNRAS
jgi:hypothetical protein